MGSDSHYLRSGDATASSVGDRVVLYHRVTRTAIVLNPTGSWMWQQLEAPQTAADLARSIRERYPSVRGEDAERDVAAFLADLVTHAMVLVRE